MYPVVCITNMTKCKQIIIRTQACQAGSKNSVQIGVQELADFHSMDARGTYQGWTDYWYRYRANIRRFSNIGYRDWQNSYPIMIF